MNPKSYQSGRWLSGGTTLRDARVTEVHLGEHEGFYVMHGRIKATFEHPFLVRRRVRVMTRLGLQLTSSSG